MTAKLNDIDSQAWLADVLARIASFPQGCFMKSCRGIGAPMSGLSRYIKLLDEELLALGEHAMLLEELDGFVADLIACPSRIMPGDWRPVVWHGNSADQAPIFENLYHANRVFGLVMEHYNVSGLLRSPASVLGWRDRPIWLFGWWFLVRVMTSAR